MLFYNSNQPCSESWINGHGLVLQLELKKDIFSSTCLFYQEYSSTGELIRRLNSELGIAVSLLEFLFGWLAVAG